jgi:3-hydroxyisobutyrate dehydrogenase-like beta-hydroxyacid dehydrogenase
MGGPMAGHLANSGHQVVAYNRTPARAMEWLTNHLGCSLANSPKEAALGADFVLCCVGNDNDLRDVLFGNDGAVSGMAKGSTLVDHTTASADIARDIFAHCSAREIGFLDAPVSGGQLGAESGALSIMVGGEKPVFDAVVPIISSYTKAIALVGPAGSGQLTKMVNQICAAGVIQGLSEGLNFGRQAGLDMDAVTKLVSAGAAGSWQMDNRANTMLSGEFDFGFALDWMVKDLDICALESQRIGADLPHTNQILQRYQQLQRLGAGRLDTSALIELLKPL